MIRAIPFVLGAALMVAACAPQVPDSAAGVGFDGYDSFQERREAELAGLPPPVPDGPVIGSETAGNITLPATTGQPVETVVDINNPGISDEQNFDAVAERESIESDAERLASNRQAYILIQPTDLPTRPSDGRPNIVAFALATNNPLGEPLYDRRRSSENRFLRACARFTSPDLAQEEFLARGGPDRDGMGVDPDGDGFACGWDPSPFRAVLGG